MKRWIFKILLILLFFAASGMVVQRVGSSDFAGPMMLTQSRRQNQVRRWLGGRPSRPTKATRVGKNHELVRTAFNSIIAPANKSTGRIYANDQQVAMATVVSTDGFLVTKASELNGDSLMCKLPNRQRVPAKLISKDKDLDLALLKIETTNLKAIEFANLGTATELGSWVAVPGGYGERPIVVGTVSARTRRIPQDKAILGVEFEYATDGVLVQKVLPGSGAESAGIKKDDVIVQFNNAVIRSPETLVFQVGLLQPGERAKIVVKRDGESKEFNPRMGRRMDILYAEQGLEAHEGGPLSQRRSGFRRVIQHDCLLSPNQCGGPLVNLDGKTIGINIARAGRVATYALSFDIVKSRIDYLVHSARNASN